MSPWGEGAGEGILIEIGRNVNGVGVELLANATLESDGSFHTTGNVYYKTGEFTCCKDSKTGWTPHPIHIGEVRQWPPDYRKLGGPFASQAAANQWVCGRPVYPHPERNWALISGVVLTRLPCPVNR